MGHSLNQFFSWTKKNDLSNNENGRELKLELAVGPPIPKLRVLEQLTKPNMAQNKSHRMMLMGTKLKKEKA